MTRGEPGVRLPREVGASASTTDGFDRRAVRAAVAAAAPDVVIDQLTWLPADPADIIKSIPNDTRLHQESGSNLFTAAEELGVAHYILQSRGFYLDAPSGQLAHETTKPRYDAPGLISDASLDKMIQRSSNESALVAECICKGSRQ